VITMEDIAITADNRTAQILNGQAVSDADAYGFNNEGIDDTVLSVKGLNLWYGEKQVLFDVDMPVAKNSITALIGPSGCGKSTLLRCMNRMNDLVDGCRVEGRITYAGEDIYAAGTDINAVRKCIGMIFQKPNPFPKSIRENIVYGPRIHGITKKGDLDEIVERTLRQAALWDEVKDRLDTSGLSLSGGQQQRLCIARALAVDPDIILMDEPTSALDPIATAKIEELCLELKKRYTVVTVTHNMQQARRISDKTGFMYMGKMVEFGDTEKVFDSPAQERTMKYVSGMFG